VVEAVGDWVEVLPDGGIRRGSDVAKGRLITRRCKGFDRSTRQDFADELAGKITQRGQKTVRSRITSP
jgi:hypothetical protein